MLCEMTNNMGQINYGPCIWNTTQRNGQSGSIITLPSHSLEVFRPRLSQETNCPDVPSHFLSPLEANSGLVTYEGRSEINASYLFPWKLH